IKEAVTRLNQHGMEVSLFIDPDFSQIEAAKRVGAPVIEIHTGAYADAQNEEARLHELARITEAAQYAAKLGLIVNAGHGLHCQNVAEIARIPEINELNIGHAIVARAIFIGLANAVKEIKQLMLDARRT